MHDMRGTQNSPLRRQPARAGGPTSFKQSVTSSVESGHGPSDQFRNSRSSGKRGGRKVRWLIGAGGALIVVLAATSVFFFWQYKASSDGSDDAQASQRIIDKVSSLYIVPEDEDPTVAEIKDKEKLKDQAFFDNAQNGDYLLVYPGVGVALLYRESIHKLVNVSPVDNTQQGQQDVTRESMDTSPNSVPQGIQGEE